MNNILFHLIVALACWRLTNLFVNERGMFGIFSFIRKLLGEDKIKYDEMSNTIYPNELIHMLSCKFCTSVVVGYGFAIAQFKTLAPFEIFALGLAYSAIAIGYDKWLSRMR